MNKKRSKSKPKPDTNEGKAPDLTSEDYREVIMLIIQAIVARIMPEVEEAVREALERDGILDRSDNVVRPLAHPHGAELTRMTVDFLETQWSSDPALLTSMLTVTQFFTLALKAMRTLRLPWIREQNYSWVKLLQDAKAKDPTLKGIATIAFDSPHSKE